MKKFRPTSEGQVFLLPPSVNELVPKDHAAHFIHKIVREELDLEGIKGEYTEDRGAPPYAPAVMTGLLLYGYMKGVYSSRQLSRGCEERLDFMLVTGMSRPDHRTIAKFRRRHSEALKELFVQVVALCADAKITDLEHVALDGTRIKASAAKDKSLRYKDIKRKEAETREKIDKWLKEAERQDREEDKEHGEDDRGDGFPPAEEALERFRAAKKRLEERVKKEHDERKEAEISGEISPKRARWKELPDEDDRYNMVDPDSRIMKTRNGFIQGYNCQLAVDRKSHVIVSAHVSTCADDHGELKVALEQMKRHLLRLPKELSADTGYFSEQNVKLIESCGITGYVAAGTDPPNPARMPRAGSFARRMIERLRKGGKQSKYRLRKETVEPVIGNIKAARGFRQFLLRGLRLVALEFSLVCSAHNLWKLFQIRAT